MYKIMISHMYICDVRIRHVTHMSYMYRTYTCVTPAYITYIFDITCVYDEASVPHSIGVWY